MYNQNTPPPERSSNFKSRLIMAFIIAFIGFLIYSMNTQVNPVTGEKQHVSLSPSEEKQLGLQAAPEMARKMGGEIPTSDPRSLKVQRIGKILMENTIAKKGPWEFKFHLLADPATVNAFALPGGQIFITEGLYTKLKNEAQLAGVLGHEMGHVIERHTAEQMAKNQLGNLLVVAVGTAADNNQGATSMALFVNQMFQLKYSRHDELEADKWGIRLMREAGYTPLAMVEVLKILKEAGGSKGQGPDFFQTHPDPELRIVRINEYLKENPPTSDLSQGANLR